MFILTILNKIFPIFSNNYYACIYLLGMFNYFLYGIYFNVPLKKRKFTGLYLVIAFTLWVGYCFLVGYLRSIWPNSMLLQVLVNFSLYLISLIIAYVCYDDWGNLKPFFCWITGIAIKEMMEACFVLLELSIGVNPRSGIPQFVNNEILNSLIYDVIHFVPGLLIIAFFKKKFIVTTDKFTAKKILILSGLCFCDLVIARTIIVMNAEDSLFLYGCCNAQEVIIGMFFLLVRTGALNESEYRSEIQIMNQVLNNEEKQYEALRENIELVNIKAHDIKHQLENVQDRLTQNEITNITQTISNYDKQIHSGNPVVDTVLYSANLKCDKEKIRLTYMADGKLFDSYPNNQIYYLLSNILNNAIEATREVIKEEERLISLNIKKKGDNILIEEANFFTGQRNLNNGMINTSKEDARHHGFGLKSIRFIVNQNQGNMNIQVRENMFFLNIILPLNQKDVK